MLRSLLGRCLHLVGLVPMVIGFAVLGGPTITTRIGIAVWLMGVVGWIAGVFANDLRNWPNWILVSDYSKTLFHMGWLPAGLLGATILAFGAQQTSHFDGVFLIALATLLALALFVGNVKRIPATRESWGLLVVASFGGTSATLIHFVQLGWAGRSALALGVAGLAVATWHAVARALVQAEIVQ